MVLGWLWFVPVNADIKLIEKKIISLGSGNQMYISILCIDNHKFITAYDKPKYGNDLPGGTPSIIQMFKRNHHGKSMPATCK